MKAHRPRVTVVSFIGRPFAGKDFQAARFRDRYQHIATISTGEKLRDQEFLRKTFSPEDVDYIHYSQEHGINVRDEIVQKINHEAILDEARKGSRMIILTGNPRTTVQYDALRTWEEEESKKGEFRFDSVYVQFQINQDRADLRREERVKMEGRADDKNEESVRKRNEAFDTNIPPMLAEVSRRSTIWHRRFFSINADKSPDEVTTSLKKILQHHGLPKIRKTIEGQAVRAERQG